MRDGSGRPSEKVVGTVVDEGRERVSVGDVGSPFAADEREELNSFFGIVTSIKGGKT